MTNPFFSKSIFNWKVPAIEGGDPEKFTQKLKLAGFEAVCLKMADGAGIYRTTGVAYLTWGENVRQELIDALRDAGILILGWGFNYGVNIVGEAQVAASQSQRFNVDGWIFDCESKFESQADATGKAYTLVSEYRKYCPDIPLAICSWARFKSPSGGTWHQDGYAKAFLEKVDVGMPMMYWTGGLDPIWMLNESMRQWKNMTAKPIIPIGRAYTGDSGTINSTDILNFSAETHKQNIPGLSWWVLDQAIANPSAWAALASIPGFAPVPVPPPPSDLEDLAKRIATLESRVAMLESYHKVYLPTIYNNP